MANPKIDKQYTTPGSDQQVIPIVEEKLQVGKQTVETGITRVRKIVREREEVIDEPLLRHEAHVSRVPINRYVEQAPSVRQEADTIIVPVVEEVLVVEKRLLLKEELRITRKSSTVKEPQRIVLLGEEAVVEHVDARASGETKKR